MILFNRRRIKYLITFHLCFQVFFFDSLGQNNIIFKEFIKDNYTIIYLVSKNRNIDSLKFINVNHVVSEIIKKKDNLWLYEFSDRCGSDCKIRKQAIIVCKNEKLHISYIGYKNIYYNYSKDFGTDQIKSNINFFCRYEFDEFFFDGKRVIKESIYKNTKDTNDSITNYYSLNFEKRKCIYFTSYIKLNGFYTIDNSSSNEIKLNGKLLPMIKFSESTIVFYENKWFELANGSNKIIPLYY